MPVYFMSAAQYDHDDHCIVLVLLRSSNWRLYHQLSFDCFAKQLMQ